MQSPNQSSQNADTSREDSFPSPDGPQKATTTTNLDTGEIEPLKSSDEDEDVTDMDFGIGSDGGSAGDGGAG